MYYVYILKAVNYSNQIYIGFTKDIGVRLKSHNNGQVPHTSKLKPWKIISYSTFIDEKKALDFERYLKTGSGRAFLKKHFF